MLRAVLGAKRHVIATSTSSAASDLSAGSHSSEDQELEPWPEFLRRTAMMADAQLQKCNLSDWCTLWRQRQWRWAGNLVQRSRHKWSYRALLWEPLVDCSGGGWRARARPRKRWDDDFKEVIQRQGKDCHWSVVAAQAGEWQRLEAEFLHA